MEFGENSLMPLISMICMGGYGITILGIVVYILVKKGRRGVNGKDLEASKNDGGEKKIETK